MDGTGLMNNPAAAGDPEGMQMTAMPTGGQQMMAMGPDQQAMFAMMMQQNQAMMLQAQTAAQNQIEMQQNTKAANTTAAAMQGSAPIPKDVQLRFYKTREQHKLKEIIKEYGPYGTNPKTERALDQMNFDDLVLCAMEKITNLTNDQCDRLLPWPTVLDLALKNDTARLALVQDRGYPADGDEKRMKMHGLLQTMSMSDRLDVYDTLHTVHTSDDESDFFAILFLICVFCLILYLYTS